MPIPASRLRQANWSAAGMLAEGGIPARTTIYTTFSAAAYGNGASSISADVTTAIAACPLGQTIAFGPGDFAVDAFMLVNRGITLRGAGMGRTRLWLINGATANVAPPAYQKPIFLVGPLEFPSFDNTTGKLLTATAAAGDTSVTLANVTGLYVGQKVAIEEDHFFTGAWTSKPAASLSTLEFADAVPNLYQVWSTDRMKWAFHRKITPISIVSSNASTNEFTTSSAHGLTAENPGVTIGSLVAIENHTGIVSTPAYRHGLPCYVVTTPAPDKVTLRVADYALDPWSGALLDVTTGGTGGEFRQNRQHDDFYPGQTLASDQNSPLHYYSTGNGYYYGEVHEILSISGNVVTFTSPLMDTYRTGFAARVTWSATPHVVGAGVEDMTLMRGGDGALAFKHAAKSWAKNVEVAEWYGHGIGMSGCHRVEVFGCDVHDATWPSPGGKGYALSCNFHTSESLIWNSRSAKANKNINLQGGGAGCVVAFNTFDDSYINHDMAWNEESLSGSHSVGPHHTLFEGNDVVNFGADYTHGSPHCHTWFRNRARGARGHYPLGSNARLLSLSYGARDMSFAGNVLGIAGQMSGWQSGPTTSWLPEPMVRKIGYDPAQFGQLADPDVTSTLVDIQNYDHVSNGIVGSPESLPDSLFLSAAPSFWPVGLAWPAYNATTGAVVDIPSRAEYLNTGSFAPFVSAGEMASAGGGSMKAYVGGASNTNGAGSSSTSLSYSATAGNMLFALVTVRDPSAPVVTIAAASGWTALHAEVDGISGNVVQRAFTKIATGSDSYVFTLGSSDIWTLGVVEWSGVTTTLRTHAVRVDLDPDATTPFMIASGATGTSSVSGDLVITTLSDNYEVGAIAAPSGYTARSLGTVHFGSNFGAMGAIADKTAAGAVENPAWQLADHHSGIVGVYVFEASGGGSPARKRNRHAGDRGSRRGERRGGTQ